MRWLMLVLLLAGCDPFADAELTGTAGSPRFHLVFDNETQVDLDLHVLDPDGDELYWKETTSPSGGVLETDCKCSRCGAGPNENTFWEGGPAGTYTVFVRYYAACQGYNGAAASFLLRAVDGDEELGRWSGRLEEESDSERWDVAF